MRMVLWSLFMGGGGSLPSCLKVRVLHTFAPALPCLKVRVYTFAQALGPSPCDARVLHKTLAPPRHVWAMHGRVHGCFQDWLQIFLAARRTLQLRATPQARMPKIEQTRCRHVRPQRRPFLSCERWPAQDSGATQTHGIAPDMAVVSRRSSCSQVSKPLRCATPSPARESQIIWRSCS